MKETTKSARERGNGSRLEEASGVLLPIGIEALVGLWIADLAHTLPIVGRIGESDMARE